MPLAMSLSRALGCWLVAGLLLPAASAATEPWSDAESQFTLELPDGWRPLTPAELQRVHDAIPEPARSQVRYSAGFKPVVGASSGYPYVLVQPTPFRAENPTWDDIEAALASETVEKKITEMEGTLGSLLKGATHDATALDRTRSVYVTRMSLDLAGKGVVEALSVGHLGKGRIVQLHAYALRDEFDATLPVFEQLNESFRWDAGHEFHPGPSRWERIGRGALIGAIVGVLGGLVLGALRKRKQRTAHGSR
jgi:hypothetical protein